MDKINYKYNNYNIPFSGIQKDSSMPDKNEKLNIIVKKSMEVFADHADKTVPENGKFLRSNVFFEIPETQNEGLLFIEYDGENPKTQRRLSVGVHNKNSDRLISNYLFKGTKQEILEYLQNDKNKDEIIQSVNNLSDKTDKFHSSL